MRGSTTTTATRAIGTDCRICSSADSAVPILLRRVAFQQPAFVAQNPFQDKTIIGPALYATSIVVALFSAPVALVLFAALAGYFATGYVPAFRK